METSQKDRTTQSNLPALPFKSIAAYQFVRAFVLLLVVVVLWGAKDTYLASDTDLASHPVLATLIFLTTGRVSIQQRNVGNPLWYRQGIDFVDRLHQSIVLSVMEIIAVLAVTFAATGFGLLSRNELARKATIFTSGFAVLRSSYLLLVSSSHKLANPTSVLKLAPPISMQLVMAALLLVNLLVIVSLINKDDIEQFKLSWWR